MPTNSEEYRKQYAEQNKEKIKEYQRQRRLNQPMVECETCRLSYKKCDFKRHLETKKHPYFVERQNEIPEYLTGQQMDKLFQDIISYEYCKSNNINNIITYGPHPLLRFVKEDA